MLEDNWNDIIGKARRGLGLSHREVADKAGCDEQPLRDWESGGEPPDDPSLRRVAEALGLAAKPLSEIAHGRWKPRPVRLANFIQISSPYSSMVCNAYVAWDPANREAALFDTGTDFRALKEIMDANRLQLRRLLLTHAHSDHIALIDEISGEWKPEIFTSKSEYVSGGKKTAEGDRFNVGRIEVEVLETEGHSPGGLTFVLRHLGAGQPTVAVVGDALFAGSVGGPNHSYQRLLDNIRDKILTLPDDTVLAPGHGPLTTVGEEKAHNPFLA